MESEPPDLRPPEPGPQLDALARRVIDAAFEVHQSLGPGFSERVYEKALALELGYRGISFAQQVPISVTYRGQVIGEQRLDVLVEGGLVVELKAVESLAPVHLGQLVSYLRASGCHLGLLISFNVRQLRHGIRRVVCGARRSTAAAALEEI